MKTEALQRHRINRVMNFARNSPSKTLSLGNMADVACLSQYHFSRVFTHHCQETPLAFAARMRMEQSVSSLMYHPDLSITSIAFEAGFSSSQAFSNAFLRRYGIAPRSFRNSNKYFPKEVPYKQASLSMNTSQLLENTPSFTQGWHVTLKNMPATRLAYVRQRSAYYDPCADRDIAFSTLINWAMQNALWQDDTVIIGVCPDNAGITPPQFCQYDVGIPVEHGVDEDQTISIQNIPAATLASLTVRGPLPVLRMAWKWLISEWLPQSGMVLADHAFYETFRSRDITEDGCIIEGDLCMPVRMKSNDII